MTDYLYEEAGEGVESHAARIRLLLGQIFREVNAVNRLTNSEEIPDEEFDRFIVTMTIGNDKRHIGINFGFCKPDGVDTERWHSQYCMETSMMLAEIVEEYSPREEPRAQA